MTSTYTPNLNLDLQGTGDNSGTWGTVLNNSALAIIDQALGDVQTISLSSTNVLLNTAQSQCNFVKLTGSLSASVIVTFPAIGRTYYIKNATSGAYTVTLARTGAVDTVVIPQGTGAIYTISGDGVANVSVSNAIIILKGSASPTPTVEGQEEWDTATGQFKVGHNSSTLAFSDDSKLALLAATSQLITGGALITPLSLGTISSGTTTLDYGARPIQTLTNNGSFTLNPDTHSGYMQLLVTNGASAAVPNTSGWSKVIGSFTATSSAKFLCGCVTIGSTSVLNIQAV